MTDGKQIHLINMAKYHIALFANQPTVGQNIVLTTRKMGTLK